MSKVVRHSRRQVLKQVAALGVAPLVSGPSRADVAASSTARLAFLLGNRYYPDGQELPPITKNIRDLKAALETKGFDVTDAMDLGLDNSKAAISKFARKVSAVPPDATVFFYFSGHGVQDDARNLLIAAGINPALLGDVQNGSLELAQDVLGPLAPRTAGATFVVVDSCRVSIRAAVRNRDGFNQVEAPPGCLIAFSTAAGKPAISPADEKQNTFYTASLVKVLNAASGETSFADLFRLTRSDVRNTMLHHPVSAVRLVAQDPFIADNTKVAVPVLPPPQMQKQQQEAAAATPNPQEEEDLWRQIQASVWPRDVVHLAEKYLEQFPAGPRAQSASVALEGSLEAAKILGRNDVKLYKPSFQVPNSADTDLKRDFIRAARGDKDAAKRVGQAYRDGVAEKALDPTKSIERYVGWLQYSNWLGNGIASYDLALLYRQRDQPDLAARYESRAKELGFTPPPSLNSSPKSR